MSAERELAAPTRRTCVVRDQDRVMVVNVNCDRIVVRSPETGVDDAPALVSALAQERTDQLDVDVLIKHEAHLRNC